jgi:FtsZ-binding cell division protein ZapB
MAKTAGVEIEPIDRLEEKVKKLVGVLDTLRAEQSRAKDENHRLARELEAARARIADADARLADHDRRSAETTALRSEATVLKEEREIVRQRVADMLAQLDALNL